jgi:antitoxin FitA
MAQLIVRNIEDDVKDRLVQRARRHGHSMEEEVRTILRDAVQEEMKPEPELDFGTRLANFFAKHHLDVEIEEFKGHQARPAVFD